LRTFEEEYEKLKLLYLLLGLVFEIKGGASHKEGLIPMHD
jgi:hypothetical protein